METTQTPKEKKGLGRMWKKFKAAFKDKEEKPTLITASKSSEPTEAPKPIEEPLKASKPEPTPITIDIAEDTGPPESMQTDIDLRLEKARALFKKYDFDIDESELKFDDTRNTRPIERVQKPIKMRVRYTCHMCKTTFGRDKTCVLCQHPRCDRCTRYPPRKPKGKKKDTAAAVKESEVEAKCTCHECQTGIEHGADECPNCHHKICEQCLKQALVAVSPDPPTSEPEKKPAPSEHPTTQATTAAAAVS